MRVNQPATKGERQKVKSGKVMRKGESIGRELLQAHISTESEPNQTSQPKALNPRKNALKEL